VTLSLSPSSTVCSETALIAACATHGRTRGAASCSRCTSRNLIRSKLIGQFDEGHLRNLTKVQLALHRHAARRSPRVPCLPGDWTVRAGRVHGEWWAGRRLLRHGRLSVLRRRVLTLPDRRQRVLVEWRHMLHATGHARHVCEHARQLRILFALPYLRRE
jgi:hypothetical protein